MTAGKENWQQDLIVALLIITVLSIITMSLVVSREVGRVEKQLSQICKIEVSKKPCP